MFPFLFSFLLTAHLFTTTRAGIDALREFLRSCMYPYNVYGTSRELVSSETKRKMVRK